MQMKTKKLRFLARIGVTGALGCFLALTVNVAQAMDFDTGNPDITLSWGNTVRYNLGARLQKPDSVIANSPNTDEGDNSHKRGEVVTNRLDLLSELDFSWQRRLGFRLSGAAWYDQAFSDTVQTSAAYANLGSYNNNQFSNYTKRYNKQGAEFLDAYVFGNFDLGTMPTQIKVGRTAVLWGEAIALTAHSVSTSQAPTDGLKALMTPGVDAKETALPLGQVVGTVQVTPTLALSGQAFFEWQPSRIPEGGTYLAGTDFILRGPDHYAMSSTMSLANLGVSRPSNTGEFGVSARWQPSWFDGTVGFYARRFTEKSPTLSLNLVGQNYRAVYPSGAKLVGLSAATTIAGVSTGAELVYRIDTPLNSSITDGANVGARGDTVHLLVNGIKQWGPTALWSSATLTSEFGYSRLQKITSGENYFNGCYLRPIGDQGVGTGCSSKQNLQGFVRFSPTWISVWPGWDITGSASLSYGIVGNSPVPGGGNQRAGSYSLGVTFTYNTLYDFSLAYNGYLASYQRSATNTIRVSNGSQIQDRGWLVFTAKISF